MSASTVVERGAPAAPAVCFAALGTTISLVVTDPEAVVEATAILRAEVEAIDRACSRFRPDSDLSAVNAAGGRPVVVDRLTVEAVNVALRAARVSGGKVDPTVGLALRVLGYDRDFAQMDPVGPPLEVPLGPVAGWRLVSVDAAASTVRVPAGVSLDLGATAKALCADRAAAAIAARTGAGVIVGLGGDLAIGGPVPVGGWPVRVTDVHSAPSSAAGQTISLPGGGLATSGTTARRWSRGGQELHHLIDPATGAPAVEHWRTVSVAAGSCVDANIASTTAVILGREAPGWLAERRLPARLVRPDGQVTFVGDWPRPWWVTSPLLALQTNSQILWYMTRGTGLVDLVLLTITLVLGVSQVVRYVPAGQPRFVVNGLHRNVSLLAVLLLAVHVITTVLDTYVHIPVWDAFVPFVGTYHPFMLGLGAVALDLVVVLVASSLVRERLGLRMWRALHWTAYACWPIALVHGLGIGTDRTVAWVLVLNALCIVAVAGAVVWRLVVAGRSRGEGSVPTAPRSRPLPRVPSNRSW